MERSPSNIVDLQLKTRPAHARARHLTAGHRLSVYDALIDAAAREADADALLQ